MKTSPVWEDRFAFRMRVERSARRLSQVDMANNLADFGIKLHPSAIAKMELRDVGQKRVIRLNEAAAVSRVFGLTLDEMLSPSIVIPARDEAVDS